MPLPAGEEPALREGETLVALDLEGRAPADALELGEAAYRRLGHELVRLGAAQLAADGPPQLETLVPEYVTLPRGVRAADGIGGMVARPPVRVVIEPMRLEDLPAVHAIEQASFTAPWPPHAYRSELESNRHGALPRRASR